LLAAGSRHPLEIEQMGEHLLAGELGVEAEVLRQVAEPAAQRLRVGQDVRAVQLDAARGRLEEAGEDPHEGGLAGAVGSEQAEHPGRDVEIDSLQGRHRARVDFHQVADGQHARDPPCGLYAGCSTRVTLSARGADSMIPTMKTSKPSRRSSVAVLSCLSAALLLGSMRPALAADAPADPPAARPDFQKENAAWRQDRDKGLRDENGWLTLVGLYWLDEGENKIGSDAGNKVIFPEGKAPAVAGTLVRHGKEVRLNPAPGAGITVDGKPVTAPLDLKVDAQGKPTLLHLGSVSFFVIQRGDKVGIRMKDSQSPALASFRGLDYFPLQTTWRVEARFEPHQPAKKIPIANVLGQVADEESPGSVVFDWQGKT